MNLELDPRVELESRRRRIDICQFRGDSATGALGQKTPAGVLAFLAFDDPVDIAAIHAISLIVI
jgi:hypothetical protein